MAEEQTRDNQQANSQPDITTHSETPKPQNSINDSPNIIQPANSSTKNATSEDERIAVKDELHNAKWSRADKIATWSVIVNVIMAAVTIGAVLIALDASKSGDINFAKALSEGKKSADASVKAANAAENSLSVTKNAIKSSNENFLKSLEEYKKIGEAAKRSTDISEKQFDLTKAYSKKSDSNFLKSISIANNSLMTAQQSLIAAQNNFAIQNRAYIMLSTVNVDSIKPFVHESGTVGLKNFGKTPALLLNSVIGFYIDTAIRKDRIYQSADIKYINLYLPENNEYLMPFKFQPMDSLLCNLVLTNRIFFVIYGEVLFQDIVTSKLYTYIFSFRIMQNGRFAPTPINNSGNEIPSIDKWLNKIK